MLKRSKNREFKRKEIALKYCGISKRDEIVQKFLKTTKVYIMYKEKGEE